MVHISTFYSNQRRSSGVDPVMNRAVMACEFV